ncbi:MAG: CRISPR system precrRNA processing endoribonuclease RAMP protein Cas6 [Desulfuromusa sp.]|nr:CRISPR system precrRNA processing endoribonuclease RAMP protein Cas6 [Desulfuromusa sp.]
MVYHAPFPADLQQVEYVKLYFHLEINHYFDLPVLGLLQLRRELLQALKTIPDQNKNGFVEQLKQLLQPDLPDDPVLLRQIQKPAPALVISPDITQYGLIEPKQRIVLPVLFIGSGINVIDPFVCLIQHLGTQGLCHGSGQFMLEGVETEDGSGVRSMLWFAGKQLGKLTPPVCDLSWWLERQAYSGDSIQFEIISPLRLLHQGKPLFKAEFATIFPFLLRRVTTLLAGHAGVELIYDPARLISLASRVESLGNKLYWKDWRALIQDQGAQKLGGLMGNLTIGGDNLAELMWILQLGSFFNFGKGAAYGAGQYRLKYS